MFHRKSVFKRFLLSYLIAVSIPLLLEIVLYVFLYGTVKNTYENQYKSSLTQAQQSIEQYFEEIDNVKQQILFNPQIQKYFTEFQLNNFTLYETRNLLSIYRYSSPLISNISLYNIRNDTLIDCNTIFNLSEFYGTSFSVGDFSYEDFVSKILQADNYKQLYPSYPISRFGETDQEMLYISSFPLGQLDKKNGCILITIPSKNILDKFQISLENGGYFYMVDDAGQTLIHSEGAPALEILGAETRKYRIASGENHLFFQTSSADGLTFIATMPYRVITNQMTGITICMMLAFIATMLVDFWLIWYLAKKNTSPIREILQIFGNKNRRQSEDRVDELEQISENIAQLLEINQMNQAEIEQSLPLLTAGFIQNLLYGTVMSNEEIQQQAEKLGITLGKEYMAILASLPASPSIEINVISTVKMLLKKKLAQFVKILCADLGELDIGFIVIFDENSEDELIDLENIINETGDEINNYLSLRLRVAIGTKCREPQDIFYSYHYAKEALSHGIQTTYHNIEWYVKGQTYSQGYYYPLDIELRIVTAMRNHKPELIIESIRLVKNENCENRLLTVDQILQLFRDLKGTIYKCMNEMSLLPNQREMIEGKLQELDTTRNLDNGFDCFIEILQQLNQWNECDQTKNISAEIFHYIEMNFRNSQLNRQMFAEYFKITPEYASSFFKDNTGYTFAEYVEKIRIDSACKMLADRTQTIEMIAQEVGYNSSLSFRRAFKRCMGLSPTEYAKKFLMI